MRQNIDNSQSWEGHIKCSTPLGLEKYCVDKSFSSYICGVSLKHILNLSDLFEMWFQENPIGKWGSENVLAIISEGCPQWYQLLSISDLHCIRLKALQMSHRCMHRMLWVYPGMMVAEGIRLDTYITYNSFTMMERRDAISWAMRLSFLVLWEKKKTYKVLKATIRKGGGALI